MDTRIILRLAYDGNYERAIIMLVDELEKHEDKIKRLKVLNERYSKKIENLEKEIQLIKGQNNE